MALCGLAAKAAVEGCALFVGMVKEKDLVVEWRQKLGGHDMRHGDIIKAANDVSGKRAIHVIPRFVV